MAFYTAPPSRPFFAPDEDDDALLPCVLDRTRPDRLDLALLVVAVSALAVAVLALVLVLGVLGGQS